MIYCYEPFIIMNCVYRTTDSFLFYYAFWILKTLDSIRLDSIMGRILNEMHKDELQDQ